MQQVHDIQELANQYPELFELANKVTKSDAKLMGIDDTNQMNQLRDSEFIGILYQEGLIDHV